MNVAGYSVALYLYFITSLYAFLFTEFDSIIEESELTCSINMQYINVPRSSLPTMRKEMSSSQRQETF